MRLFGQYLDSGGNVYRVLPDNATLNLNPRVPGVAHYNATTTVTKYQLAHQTYHQALTDTNWERTNLGVGEDVAFGFAPAAPTNLLTWTTTAGDLTAGLPGGQTWWQDGAGNTYYNAEHFVAPSNAANVTVTASFFGVDGSLKTKFEVLEPAGEDHAIIMVTNHLGDGSPGNPPDGYASGHAGAEMGLNVWIKPTDVSFYRVWIMEVGTNASGISDYFADTNKWTTNPAFQLRHDTANFWFNLNPDNSWSGGDECWSDPDTYTPPWSVAGQYSGGSFTWQVPANWSMSPDSVTNPMAGWSQVFNIDGNGTVKITKFPDNRWVQRTTNNVITTSSP